MQLIKRVATIAITSALFSTTVHGFWRMECRARSGIARIDPLISPGVPSQHVHAVHGGSNFSMTADTAALQASDCTSCSVAQDKSAYWHPALYFQATDGTLTAVPQVGGMLAYYLLYPNAGETAVKGFPAGFEMIAGTNDLRNFTLPVPDPPKSTWASDPEQSSQDALAQKAIGFNCLNYAAAPEGSLYRHFLPDKAYIDANCKDGVRFELMFPSCWNGVDLAPPGKKSHMRYPSLVMTGDCPAGFTTRTVSLFYEIIYNTPQFAGQAGSFVIANGDPTGYGYHGDFIMGWDETFLQDAVNTCTNPSGEISDCPLFTIQDSATYSACSFPVPAALKSENVLGPIAALPGGVQIQAGPAPASANAPAATNAPGTSAVVPTLSYSSGYSISGSQYEPGGIFVTPQSSTSTPVGNAVGQAVSSSTTSPTTTLLQDSEKVISTSTITQGAEVMEIVIIEQDITVTQDVTTTIIGASQRRKRHLHQHHHLRRGEVERA